MDTLTKPDWTADEIKALRLWARESITSWGRRLGVSRFTAHAWEAGTRRPRPENLKALDTVAKEEGYRAGTS